MKGQPWYRKIAMILLLPLVLPAVLLALPFFAWMWLYAECANYSSERRVLRTLRESGRYLSLADVLKHIEARGGTLIIEFPSFGWNYTRAWWTPDDVLSISPFSVPSKGDYEQAYRNCECLDWDKWCLENYTCMDSGCAYLLRVWNGAALEPILRQQFPALQVIRAETAAVHLSRLPEYLNRAERKHPHI
jgi:hypothetical protein